MYCNNNPIMYVDENGNIAGLVTFFIGIILGKNVKEAYDTAGSLGISGIEQILYAASGIVAGNYYVVKDNWDKVSETIKMDGEYNFMFQDNPYYNFKTAHLYAKYLKENFYSEESTRSTLGLYIELQFHYGLFKVGNERGIDGSYMGPAIWQEDSSAFCSEVAATLIRIFYHIQRLRTKT